MKKPKQATVTIGIPAHNEEANIVYLLKSILKQKGDNFVIEKIYVFCDGCTDKTAEKASMLAKKYEKVDVKDDGEQEGKRARLNQLYTKNNSDFVFNIDADVVLKGDKVIEKMVDAFDSEEIVLVSGNNQPAEALSLFERFYNAGYRMWYEIRKDYRGGNNARNIQGMIVGLRTSFAKSFKYPEKTYVSDGACAYFESVKQNKRFRFVKDSVVLFRSVDNLRDYFLQATRNLNAKKSVANYFGNWVYKEHYIPRGKKVKGIIKAFVSDPIFTSGAMLLMVALRVIPQRRLWFEGGGRWKISKSTKRAASI